MFSGLLILHFKTYQYYYVTAQKIQISVSKRTFKQQITLSNIFIKYNFLTSDTFCNLISMPCFSRPRFFRVQFFQSLGFQGAGFSGLRFFKVQVFLATGVCRVYIFQGICFPGSRFSKLQIFQSLSFSRCMFFRVQVFLGLGPEEVLFFVYIFGYRFFYRNVYILNQAGCTYFRSKFQSQIICFLKIL